jgi:exonuclease VII small subunit
MTQLREALVRAAGRLKELEELVVEVDGLLEQENVWLGWEEGSELDGTCKTILEVNHQVWSISIRDKKWTRIRGEVKDEEEAHFFLGLLQSESQWPVLTGHYERFDERDWVQDR